jgi:PelA/Pel-15E family pectate lyase
LNETAVPVSEDRILKLVGADQADWKTYLEASMRKRQAEQDDFAAELKAHRALSPIFSMEGKSSGLHLERSAEWFCGEEARTIADNVLSFQTLSGGWSKNIDFSNHARLPGEFFAPLNIAPANVAESRNSEVSEPQWHYVGTFDNDGTIKPLRFLAKMTSALGPEKGAKYRAAVMRGLHYLLAAQFPNGGWPQVYPLEGGYHDAITFNDGAMIKVLRLLDNVAAGSGDFAFVSSEDRARASAAVKRGVECILKCQIASYGNRSVWCQQHDALTLLPTSGRNYELAAQVSTESASVMIYLMDISDPGADVIKAVHSAAVWFERTKVSDATYGPAPDGKGRLLLKVLGAGPIWARYYEVGSDRPLFGDRDKTIHDDVRGISRERRDGYKFYISTPSRALERYKLWLEKHPVPCSQP